jgi:hypothetical protein
MGADGYVNPINGTELYNKEDFQKRGIKLNFIVMDEILYPQYNQNNFIPYMSIIDVLMFNGKAKTIELVNKFTLN